MNKALRHLFWMYPFSFFLFFPHRFDTKRSGSIIRHAIDVDGSILRLSIGRCPGIQTTHYSCGSCQEWYRIQERI